MESWYDAAPEVFYTDKDGERYLRLVWEDVDITAEARVEQVGPALRATEFTVRAPSGIPTVARRLPSDGRVVQHLRDAGNEGITALALVLGEWDVLGEVVRAEQHRPDREGAAPGLDEALAEYGRRVNRRPRRRINNQVQEVVAWLAEGWMTTDIIDELQSRGVARRTAYRRLADAKSLDHGGERVRTGEASND